MVDDRPVFVAPNGCGFGVLSVIDLHPRAVELMNGSALCTPSDQQANWHWPASDVESIAVARHEETELHWANVVSRKAEGIVLHYLFASRADALAWLADPRRFTAS